MIQFQEFQIVFEDKSAYSPLKEFDLYLALRTTSSKHNKGKTRIKRVCFLVVGTLNGGGGPLKPKNYTEPHETQVVKLEQPKNLMNIYEQVFENINSQI